jgi:two-component system cell cycle response regulator
MRVLIADDEKISRMRLAHTLEAWSYEVVPACDGTEAWRVLQKGDAPQLAILDWMMPGMTGPEVCAAVRHQSREPYTYILLLTARTEKQDLVEGMESGADDYITKPFDAAELRVRLRAGRRILDLQSQLMATREALREQATHDPLTCLSNRHAILDLLARETNRAARENTCLAVVMADLDHFKLVNDTYGHLAGDAVLREAAQRLQTSLRSYDAVGRYGGEEFLVVLPGGTQASAMQLAERLRATMCAQSIEFNEGSLCVTMSLGVTAVTPGTHATPEEMIRAADEALYRAKDRGRNRVEWNALDKVMSGVLTR